MNIAVIKTKAESQLAEQFEKAAPSLPGGGWVPAARKAAFGAFASRGLPHRRIEEWKYTDLRNLMKEAFSPAHPGDRPFDRSMLDATLGASLAKLECIRLVFVNGAFRKDISSLGYGHGKAYHFDSLSEVLARGGFDWMKPHFGDATLGAIQALNTAMMTDGTVLRIVDGARLEKPIHLVFFADAGAPAGITTRNLIEAGRDAHAVILESHVGPGNTARQSNSMTEFAVKDGANVAHIKLVAEGSGATHLGAWNTHIGANATYRGYQMTSGTGLVRNEIGITFGGSGGKLDLSGCFLGRGTDHIDTTLTVDHAVPHCESRELFKGVLDDRARGIFQGKIIVRPDAQKTDGKQMAQVLMLSPDAEFDSKPELEIYADDVVCGHGSTAAEIDPDLVFYCKSRGIPEDEARALLIESFIGEAIEKVEHEGIRAAFLDIARAWLKAGENGAQEKSRT